ncbi:MAG: helix-turn-helix transcriptional regulator [Sandarakinorhabdus sp.]|nr:helix-turn-helix transcriptional regulator [Sandarakinorhabdus sp.]
MTALHASRELAVSVAEKLKLYAQPQRLMILSCLLAGERNVAAIGAATGIGQPALSQQLAELRRAGLVAHRREAREIRYTLADEGVASCVRTMEAVFGSNIPGTSASAPVPPRAAAPGIAHFAQTP